MPVVKGDASEQIEQTIPLTKEEFIALANCSKNGCLKIDIIYQLKVKWLKLMFLLMN